MNYLLRVALMVLFAGLSLKPAFGQYTLDEVALTGGPGLVAVQHPRATPLGTGLNVAGFFSHYFCGKAYGVQFNVGFQSFMNPEGDQMPAILDDADLRPTGYLYAGADLGAYFKVRLHEKHRWKEWALMVGPRIGIPFLQRLPGQSRGLSAAAKVHPLMTGVELGVQFRRPAGKKKSWFIHPGAVYYLQGPFSDESQNATYQATPVYLFLNFGYTLMTKRG